MHWPHVRARRNLSGASASLLAAYAAALSLTTPSWSKTPGEVHCYNGICHRVKSVEEMRPLVAMETEALTSYYDTAEHDSMNVGTVTSSGEEFDADSDSHAASSVYPDGTELLVWNPKNRRAAHIRVNDFGPFYMLRTIDVTRGVAEKLEFVKSGVAKLRIIVIWAPDREDARFRRRRTYAPVEGYIGAIDSDQLTALKSRLIQTAPARNGHLPQVATTAGVELPTPAYSFLALPAFASQESGNAPARRMAAVMNAPCATLAPVGVSTTVKAVPTLWPIVAGSSLGPAAISRQADAVVMARDADEALVVASLAEPARAMDLDTATSPDTSEQPPLAQEASFAGPAAIAPVDDPAAIDVATALAGAVFTGPWTPTPLRWQQLLVALGVLSAATFSLRMRSLPAQGKRLRKGKRPAAAHSPARTNDLPVPMPRLLPVPMPRLMPILTDEPAQADTLDVAPILAMPHLQQPPAGQSMEALRDEAIAHMERYAYIQAEATYRALLAERESVLGSADPMTASAERQLADCLREQGRYAAAEHHYRRALCAMVATVGEMHPATADILDEYATSLLRQGHGNSAEILARQALAIRRYTDSRSREYAVTLSIVAETLRAQGQLVAAEIEHRTAWSLFIAISGEDSTDAAASMTHLGALLGELGRFAAAEELLNQGTRAISALCGPQHPATATGYGMLGDIYRRAGALEPSQAMHRHALAIREGVLGPRHPDTVESVLSLAIIAAGLYRTEEARLLLDRGLDALISAERTQLGPQSRVRSLLVALSRDFETTQPTAIAAE